MKAFPLAADPPPRGWHALAGMRVGGDRPASGVGHEVQEDLMTSTIDKAGRRIALEEIRVPENVRAR
jgi:hypothetical protein